MICVSREDIEQNRNYYVQKIYDELDKAVFITLQMLKWDNENDRSTIYYFQKCEIDEETGNIIGEFTPKKDEKIIRIVPISPTEIKTKSIINKEDIETKYRIVTYNPNKPNKKGND